jgi:single-stranded DNA-binding protein
MAIRLPSSTFVVSEPTELREEDTTKQFRVATTEYAGNGKERPEYDNIVTWHRLAEICGRYLGKPLVSR